MEKPITCPVLIGRTRERAALHTIVDTVKSGQGRVALISGEAGIGKSRLIAEAKAYAAAQRFLLLQGHCYPTDTSCPYAPLLDLLRSFLAHPSTAEVATDLKLFAPILVPLLPDLVFLLPDPAPALQLASLDPEQEKRRLFEALTQFFTRQALKQPVLLIVEDLHWSDDTSLDYLHYLARRCAAHPLLVLLTYRSDEVRPRLRQWLAEFDRERLAQELALSPLAHNHVDAMLRAIFDVRRPIYAEALEALYTLTEGNPFFIEEVLSSLIARGVILDAQSAWDRKLMREFNVPRSIQSAVQQRTERLSPAARELLALAAVAGQRFDFALLQHLEEATQALEAAKQGALERQDPAVLWTVHRSLGRVYQLLRREEQARGEFSAARQLIEELATTIADASLRDQFLQTALGSLPQETPLPRREAAKQAFGGLTTREREVAALIAQGKTSREIAELLVVSERTAEVHVSNILGKLGFTSRAQIAVWAVEKGLAKH